MMRPERVFENWGSIPRVIFKAYLPHRNDCSISLRLTPKTGFSSSIRCYVRRACRIEIPAMTTVGGARGSRSVCHARALGVAVDKWVKLPTYPRSHCHGTNYQFVAGGRGELAIILSGNPIVPEPIALPIATGVACGRPRQTGHRLERRLTKTIVVNDAREP
jgi:hypothetical protein